MAAAPEAVEPMLVEIPTHNEEGRALRKSDRVRMRIALAKAHGETQEDVINWTIEAIGFKRALARVYT